MKKNMFFLPVVESFVRNLVSFFNVAILSFNGKRYDHLNKIIQQEQGSINTISISLGNIIGLCAGQVCMRVIRLRYEKYY